MNQITLVVSQDLMEAIQVPPPEKLSRLYQELAIRLYQKELLSFGKARELAQMTKWEFHELLGRENIIRHYDIAELEVDLKTLEQLT